MGARSRAPNDRAAARLSDRARAFSIPSQVRGIYYLMFLFWLFAAVAIVADVFMAAIETITSQKKTIVYEGHEFRVNGARARAHALSCPRRRQPPSDVLFPVPCPGSSSRSA